MYDPEAVRAYAWPSIAVERIRRSGSRPGSTVYSHSSRCWRDGVGRDDGMGGRDGMSEWRWRCHGDGEDEVAGWSEKPRL